MTYNNTFPTRIYTAYTDLFLSALISVNLSLLYFLNVFTFGWWDSVPDRFGRFARGETKADLLRRFGAHLTGQQIHPPLWELWWILYKK